MVKDVHIGMAGVLYNADTVRAGNRYMTSMYALMVSAAVGRNGAEVCIEGCDRVTLPCRSGTGQQ